MWARHALFAVLALAGLASLGGAFLRYDRLPRPHGVRPAEAEPPDFAATLARVNAEFALNYGPNSPDGLAAAGPAPSLAIARRLSLGLTGTVPSLEEIRALEAQPSELQVEWHLAHLLEDRRCHDFLAERLARAYVGNDNGPFIIFRRRRFVLWLSDRLAENQLNYGQIVARLIAEDGLWTTNPPVNFMTATMNPEGGQERPDEVRLAARTARSFLGLRIDCLQCHDNNLPYSFPLGPDGERHDGLQTDFHQLAAFYSEVQNSAQGILDAPREYEYQYLHADETQVVTPGVPYAPELLPAQGERRERLAAWVTHPKNKPFARAAVNRVWALLCGRPLVEPLDDVPLDGYDEDHPRRWWAGPGRFPPGMEALAEDFAAHGYDLRRLIRLIAATDAFRRDSRSEQFEIAAAHEQCWAVFPLSQLRPQQVAGAMMQAVALDTIDARSNIVLQLDAFGKSQDFVRRFGDPGEEEFEERSGTIPQRLLMMNGEVLREKLQENGVFVPAPQRISLLAPSPEKAVEIAYLTALTRRPSARETEHFAARLRETPRGEWLAELQDLYWVLFNSTEFSWNH